MKMMRIMFVCTGNTCRSPMAEIILKSKLKLAGIKNVRVSSAGLCANEGEKISKNSSLALKQMGLKSYSFKSKQLTPVSLLKSDLVLCMTSEHKRAISSFPGVYSVSEYTGLKDISDPYGQDLSVYIKTSHEIEDVCNEILNKILNKGE
ncbi:MAG: low molecular weight protein arginine phosphatase [Clostridia bacterium]|nr:low molecular weight protein arginine phosphatase [Clostridia bacterium]